LQLSFDTLKHALASAPVLALPDFCKGFTIETDASSIGIGAVVSQDGHPIAFSKSLGPRAQALSTYEKECLALILAVTKWKSYLQHKEFVILTNHRSLIHLGDQKLMEGMQQKAFVKLLGLQYKIQNSIQERVGQQGCRCFVSSIGTTPTLGGFGYYTPLVGNHHGRLSTG